MKRCIQVLAIVAVVAMSASAARKAANPATSLPRLVGVTPSGGKLTWEVSIGTEGVVREYETSTKLIVTYTGDGKTKKIVLIRPYGSKAAGEKGKSVLGTFVALEPKHKSLTLKLRTRTGSVVSFNMGTKMKVTSIDRGGKKIATALRPIDETRGKKKPPKKKK